jgi:hypothetical protein
MTPPRGSPLDRQDGRTSYIFEADGPNPPAWAKETDAMVSRRLDSRPTAAELAAEILRRANASHGDRLPYIKLSDPPTPQERLQLAAATLQGIAVLITEDECMTAEEWEARYCTQDSIPIMRSRGRPSAPDIAAEIVRRVNGSESRPPYVIRLSDPPTCRERLQLIAAQLQRTPIAIMPHKCSMDEWIARYGRVKG